MTRRLGICQEETYSRAPQRRPVGSCPQGTSGNKSGHICDCGDLEGGCYCHLVGSCWVSPVHWAAPSHPSLHQQGMIRPNGPAIQLLRTLLWNTHNLFYLLNFEINDSQVPRSTEEKMRQETLPSAQARCCKCRAVWSSSALPLSGLCVVSPRFSRLSPQWAWCALCSISFLSAPSPSLRPGFSRLLAPQVGAFLVVLCFTVTSLPTLQLCFLMPVPLPLSLSTTFLPDDTSIPSYMLDAFFLLALVSLLLVTPHSKCWIV